jgi:hypothetical protein
VLDGSAAGRSTVIVLAHEHDPIEARMPGIASTESARSRSRASSKPEGHRMNEHRICTHQHVVAEPVDRTTMWNPEVVVAPSDNAMRCLDCGKLVPAIGGAEVIGVDTPDKIA